MLTPNLEFVKMLSFIHISILLGATAIQPGYSLVYRHVSVRERTHSDLGTAHLALAVLRRVNVDHSAVLGRLVPA